MPIKAYVGLPRAGKTYEVVVNVILAGLRQGRRVVSNIAGLNYDAMCQVLYREGYPQEKIGKLVLVDHSEVEKPTFWRTDKDEEEGTETFVQPGDLIALDEIWRFWKKRGEIHPRAQNFFRMHGHMPDRTTGLVCEVALITQSIRDINENIRDVIAETFQMVKNTKLGSDKSYIVHVFQRGSTSKGDFIRTLAPRFYNSDYFPLYKSHSQKQDGAAEAQEANPDKRGSILKGGLFTVGLPLAVVLFGVSLWGVIRFFSPKQPEKVESVQVKPETAQAGQVAQSARAAGRAPEVDKAWRCVGWYVSADSVRVTLINAAGEVRVLVNPPVYKMSPMGVEVELPEGGFATPWTMLSASRTGALL